MQFLNKFQKMWATALISFKNCMKSIRSASIVTVNVTLILKIKWDFLTQLEFKSAKIYKHFNSKQIYVLNSNTPSLFGKVN